MTTTALPDTDPSAPRKGLDDPASPSGDPAALSNLTTGTALADTNPTSTALAFSGGTRGNNTFNNNGGRNGDRYRGFGSDFRNKDNNGKGMNPIAERALISVGSIGETGRCIPCAKCIADSNSRWLHLDMLPCLDRLADDEEVEGQKERRD